MERAYDLVVVGAGTIGLSCAWRCAQAGMSVLVVEREAPGAGASGVAAGMLAPVTEAAFGEQALLALNLDARARWPAFAAELEELTGLPTGYADCGALVVAADRDDAEELRRLHAFQVELGLDAEWLAPRAARHREPGLSPRIAGAIHAPQDGQADPSAVVRALVAALVAAGGELRCGLEVTGIETAGGRVGGVQVVPVDAVEDPDQLRVAGLDERESIRAGAVLVAAGAWSAEGGLVTEASAPPVRPVKGQLLELRVRRGHRPPARHIVRTPRCYLVTRHDATVGAGLRPGTPDNSPAVGPGEIEGLLWATGHHRNGVMLAPSTAGAIAALLTDGELPRAWTAFSPRRFLDEVPA